MSLKQVFRFPELLLLAGMFTGPLIIGDSGIDIHFHDTYYIFGTGDWFSNALFIIIAVVLVVSWVFHLLIRRSGYNSYKLRWVQVILSVSCLLFIFITALTYMNFRQMPGRYTGHTGNNIFMDTSLPLAVAILVFILSQFFFWLIAGIVLIRKSSSSG